LFKKILNDQGKVDVPLLLDQIRTLIGVVNDLGTRLRSLEKEEFVTLTRFEPFTAKIGELEAQVSATRVVIEAANAQIVELQESTARVSEIESSQDAINQRMDRFDTAVQAVKAAAANNEEGIHFCKKGLVAARAAIATLRGHSEETRGIADEARRTVSRVRDDIGMMDARVKKLVAFVQSELIDNGNQMKDLQRMVERADERIDAVNRSVVRLQTVRTVAPLPIAAPRPRKRKSKSHPQPRLRMRKLQSRSRPPRKPS
jgi:chromosome segregation ATPase